MPTPSVTNRYHYDLKACYYAVGTVTAGAVTYGTPVKFNDSVSLSLSKKGDPIEVKSDGILDVIGYDNQGYDGDFETFKLPESFETDCLKSTKNTDGTIDETESDGLVPFALLFEFKGDKKGVRHCLYWCYASRPNVEGDNPTSAGPKNEKIKIICRPRPSDGKIKTKTGDTTTTAVFDAWFTAVPEQVAAVTGSGT